MASNRQRRRKASRIVERDQGYGAQRAQIQGEIGQANTDLADQSASLDSMGNALQHSLTKAKRSVRRQGLLPRDRRIALGEIQGRRTDVRGGTAFALSQAKLDTASTVKGLQKDLFKLSLNQATDINQEMARLRGQNTPLTPGQQVDVHTAVSIGRKALAAAAKDGATPRTPEDWQDFASNLAQQKGVSSTAAAAATRQLHALVTGGAAGNAASRAGIQQLGPPVPNKLLPWHVPGT